MNLLFSGQCPKKNVLDIGGAAEFTTKLKLYREHSIELPDLEFCFYSIKVLIEDGWKLDKVKILDENQRLLIDLSRDVLEGEPILQHIATIKRGLDNSPYIGKLELLSIIVKRIIWG
ncbi:hypothetical protein [Spirosoma aerophilum]